MSTPALFTLTGQYRALALKLADMDLDVQAIVDTIESTGITDQIAEKAQGCEMVARTLEADVPAIDAEIRRLQDLKRARVAKAEALREYVLRNMQAAEIQRIDAPLFSISVAKKPAAVEVFQPELVPAEYLRQPEPPPPAVDKQSVARALKAGQDVPGCVLKAGFRLSVK